MEVKAFHMQVYVARGSCGHANIRNKGQYYELWYMYKKKSAIVT